MQKHYTTIPPERSGALNFAGAAGRAKLPLAWLRGKTLFVIGDCDKPGQKGAAELATKAAAVAGETRHVKLPFEITEDHGRDLRDYFNDGHGMNELRTLADAAEVIQPETDASAVFEESVDDPHRLARVFLASHKGLRLWRDQFFIWEDGAYRVLSDSELRGLVTKVVKGEFDAAATRALAEWLRQLDKAREKPKPAKVTRTLINNVLNALASEAILSTRLEQPCWLDSTDSPFPAGEVFPTKSGLLHLPSVATGKPRLIEPTPDFFSANVVNYAFDPNATCPTWESFLRELWPDDEESVSTLQEWFGYCLLPDTSFHKMAMLIGPTRGGKGTVARVLKALLGERNVATPTLSDLAGPFAVSPLLGKILAIIGDARLSTRVDGTSVAEKLLAITGEDAVDVPRKFLPTLTAVNLPTRFLLLSNELPRLRDASAAFMSRVVLLRLTRSFLGKEDWGLTKRLYGELSGILNWSIAGWAQLTERGRFVQPESAVELLEDLRDLVSPVGQFVRDCCDVGESLSVTVDDLYSAWRDWCEGHGRKEPGFKESFGKDLRAVVPSIRKARLRDGENRVPTYTGIAIKGFGHSSGHGSVIVESDEKHCNSRGGHSGHSNLPFNALGEREGTDEESKEGGVVSNTMRGHRDHCDHAGQAGIKHKRDDCISQRWWEHSETHQRYCSDCWPCPDSRFLVREGWANDG